MADDLSARLRKAEAELTELASKVRCAGRAEAEERCRLLGKAEGVALAASYLRDYHALDAAPPPERVREPAMRDPKALHAAIMNALLMFGPIDSDDQDDGMVADAVTNYVYGLDDAADLVLVETAPMPSRERLCGRCDGRGVVTTSGLGTPLIPCPDCRAALSPDSGADPEGGA